MTLKAPAIGGALIIHHGPPSVTNGSNFGRISGALDVRMTSHLGETISMHALEISSTYL